MFTKKITFTIFSAFISTGIFAQTIQEGVKALQMENYVGALKTFESIISKEPTNGLAYYYAGDTKFTTGDIAGAKSSFKKGSEMAPKEGSNFAGLALIAMEENNSADAKANAAKAVSLGKKDAAVINRTAEAFYEGKTKDFARAEELLNTSMALVSKNTDTYMHRGDMYYAKKDLGNAIVNYGFVTDFDPKNFVAHYKLGKIYISTKNYKDAIVSLEKSAAAEPNFAPTNRELSDIYSIQKDYQKAKDYFGKYASMAEDKIEVKERYAKILYQAKDFQNAIKEASEFLKTDPNNVVMNRLMGNSNLELNNDAEALKYLNKVFEVAKPGKVLPQDYEFIAKLYEKSGQDSMAMVMKEKMIELDPSKADMYSDMGAGYYKMKKFDLSAKAYQNAIDKKTKKSVNDVLGLGSALYFTKDYAGADAAFAKAIEMSPNSIVSFQWRGKCNAKLDADLTKGLAVPFYQKVTELATDTTKFKSELIEANRYLGKYSARKDIDFAAGSGVPFYTKLVMLATSDPVKYKNDLIEAHKYLGSYYGVIQNYDEYKSHWLSVKALAPEDKDMLDVMTTIK